jgi:hypothetical protein
MKTYQSKFEITKNFPPQRCGRLGSALASLCALSSPMRGLSASAVVTAAMLALGGQTVQAQEVPAGPVAAAAESAAAIGSHVPLPLIGGRFVWWIGYPLSGDNPYTGEPNGILYQVQFTFNSNGSGTAIWGIRQITYEGGLQSTVQTDIWFYTNVKWTFNGTQLTAAGSGWYTRTNSTNPAMNTRRPISNTYHFPFWQVVGSAGHPILDIQEPFKFGGYYKIAMKKVYGVYSQSEEPYQPEEPHADGVPPADTPGLR